MPFMPIHERFATQPVSDKCKGRLKEKPKCTASELRSYASCRAWSIMQEKRWGPEKYKESLNMAWKEAKELCTR